MGHRPLIVGSMLVLLLWSGAMVFLLGQAGLPPDALGRATVQFPPTWARERMFQAIVGAGARPMRDTWLPGVTQVQLDEPGSVGRLAVLGAWLVLPPVPFEAMGMGGCSWLPPAVDAAPPQISKLRAGPL